MLGVANRLTILVALRDRSLLIAEIEEATRRQSMRVSWVPILIGDSAFIAGMVTPLASLAVLVFGSPLISTGVRRWAARA